MPCSTNAGYASCRNHISYLLFIEVVAMARGHKHHQMVPLDWLKGSDYPPTP